MSTELMPLKNRMPVGADGSYVQGISQSGRQKDRRPPRPSDSGIQKNSAAPASHRNESPVLLRDHPIEHGARSAGPASGVDLRAQLPPGAWLQRSPAGPADAGQKTDAGQTPDAGRTTDQADAGQPDAGQLDTHAAASGKLDFSPRGTTAGMLERLFAAETVTPLQESSYDEADGLKCMQAIGACIVDRMNDGKKRWPRTIDGVVKEKGQFQGFDKYPNYGEGQRQHNIEVLKWANQKSKFQAACRTFVNNTKQVAADTIGGTVSDPFVKDGGTYGMRTAGSSGPGAGFKKVGTAGGNDFYTAT